MCVNSGVKFSSCIDMTMQAEALYRFVVETIKTELPKELSFLADYDKVKQKIQDIVDMPDRLIDLFIRFVLQNHGRLSKGKKEKYFHQLTPTEIAAIEEVVSTVF